MLELYQLVQLLAIAECGTISKAANSCTSRSLP